MKKLTAFISVLALGFSLSALTLNFQEENYSGSVKYNSEAEPGEAVFARMNIKFSRNSKKKNSAEPRAVLQLHSGEKRIEHASFYQIPQKRKGQQFELLAGIPLSMWLDADREYSLKIVMSVSENEEKEIFLPFSMREGKFIQETIELNSENTKIKSDMGPERLSQIEKLNRILGTVDPDSVHSLKPFVRPVESERMTAFCGDRRTYRYSNGKTETSLHYGDDYGVPEGTVVSAAQDGRVVLAEFRISTGWSVVIEHLPGLYSLYYHLSSLNVKEGAVVKAGQKIGLSGSTGLATGPHLHWEARLNMAAVKPDFFRGDYTFEAAE